jgi:hypothetical protein
LPLRLSFCPKEIGMTGRNEGEKRPSTALGTNGEGRIRPGKNRKLQMVQPGRRKLFGKLARKDFLEWFAATANLGWSARQAGFNYKTVLRHRMNDAAFAEAYDRALAQGFARLQGQLLETEIEEAAEGPIGIEGDWDVPEMQKVDPEFALRLLREHGRYLAGPRAGAGEARKQGRRPRVATNAEVKTALEKALKIFERRIGPESGAS